MQGDNQKDLQWGEHHSGKKGVVKDKDGNLVSNPNKIISSDNSPSNLAEEEPGRNREGVREGASNADKPTDKTAD